MNCRSRAGILRPCPTTRAASGTVWRRHPPLPVAREERMCPARYWRVRGRPLNDCACRRIAHGDGLRLTMRHIPNESMIGTVFPLERS